MARFGSIFTRIAAKIIAVDDTVVPKEQMIALNDMLARQRVEVPGGSAMEMLAAIKRKHWLNSITVSKLDSGIVFSSEGNGNSEAKNASSLLSFINKNLSRTDVIALRGDKEWLMLFPHNGRLFIVRANSSIPTVELRAVAREVESLFEEQKIS